MPTPEEIRLQTEARERLRHEGQATKTRQTAREAIVELLSHLHKTAHQIIGYRSRQDFIEAKQKDWVSEHHKFTDSEHSTAFWLGTSASLLSAYPAVYLLDLFLLSANAKLFAKDLAQGNQYIIYAVMFGLPFAILLFETAFQTQWSAGAGNGQKWFWGIASIVVCLVVPATIVGFSMATSVNSGGARTAQVQSWFLYGKAALAFFAHFIILCGGKFLTRAKTYAIFKSTDVFLKFRLNRLARRIGHFAPILTNTFTDYFHQLNAFNTVHAAHIIAPGPFDALTRNEINRSFGYEIIAAPPTENPPSNTGANNTPNDGDNLAAPPTRNNTPNHHGFVFDMDGEDEVRP